MSKTLHKWEGWVDEIMGDTFWAELITVEGEGAEEKRRSVGDIFIREVHPDDRDLIQPGAYFDWVIEQDDQGDSHSTIRFRRYEPITQAEIIEATERGQKMMALINGGGHEQ